MKIMFAGLVFFVLYSVSYQWLDFTMFESNVVGLLGGIYFGVNTDK